MVSVPSEEEGGRRIEDDGAGLSFKRELTRKGLHILSTAVPIAYAAGLARSIVVWGLISALAVAAAVEFIRVRSARARSLFNAGVGSLLREHERHSLSGATWLIIALLTAAAFFPRDIAIAAMCAVSLGDAVAAIAGRTLAHAYSTQRKSFVGSVACLAASAIGARVIADFAWPEALIVGILASLAERLRRPLDDNVRITIAVGCGILLWRMGFS